MIADIHRSIWYSEIVSAVKKPALLRILRLVAFTVNFQPTLVSPIMIGKLTGGLVGFALE